MVQFGGIEVAEDKRPGPFAALNRLKEPIDFGGLPPREEIGKVPGVFREGSRMERSRRFPARRSRRGGVREE